jgi:hypothetical protein
MADAIPNSLWLPLLLADARLQDVEVARRLDITAARRLHALPAPRKPGHSCAALIRLNGCAEIEGHRRHLG